MSAPTDLQLVEKALWRLIVASNTAAKNAPPGALRDEAWSVTVGMERAQQVVRQLMKERGQETLP